MQKMLSQIIFFFFFLFSLLTRGILFGEIQEVKMQALKLEECLLPQDHPLQRKLKKIFKDPEMFKTLKNFRKGGFHIFSRKEYKIMVGSHPFIKNYLIKKFSDIIPQEMQLLNYLKRISGARALREFIHLNHLKHIVVPQKWLYQLPNRFIDLETGERTYLLIVEDMDICQGKGKYTGETARRYGKISDEALRELCIVVYYFRGLDSGPCNIPFTHQNKMAFIDTECWDEKDRTGFLSRIMPYLRENHHKYLLEVFEELSQEPKSL